MQLVRKWTHQRWWRPGEASPWPPSCHKSRRSSRRGRWWKRNNIGSRSKTSLSRRPLVLFLGFEVYVSGGMTTNRVLAMQRLTRDHSTTLVGPHTPVPVAPLCILIPSMPNCRTNEYKGECIKVQIKEYYPTHFGDVWTTQLPFI